MSKITFDNLDKWLFNFHEGNLTSSEKRELQQFLDAHPELQDESEAWAYTKYSAPLIPIAFEAELHAIAGASAINYRKWTAIASLILLIGTSAFIYFGMNSEIKFDFENIVKNNSTNHSNINYSNINAYDSSLSNSSENNLTTLNSSERKSTNNSANNNLSQSKLGFLFGNYNNIDNLTDNHFQNALNTNSNNLSNNSNSVFANNQLSFPANLNENKNRREQVSVDITNEVRIKIERETIIVYEDEEKKILANKSNLAEEETKLELELKLKQNENNQKVLPNKINSINNNGNVKPGLDPDPTLTNMRDHILLTTNNHLTEYHNGFAGNVIVPRFSLNYRNNWTGTELNSQNAVFTYDQLLRKLKTGIALSAYYNNYNGGMFTTTGAALTISPKFKLGRGTTFEPAITVSYAQKSVSNMSNLVGRKIEDTRGNVNELYRNGILPSQNTAYMPDVKLGALLQTKKFWAAATVDHVLMPKEPLYGSETNLYRNKLSIRTTIGTDYIHIPERGNVYSPQITINHHDGYTELWAGANARFRQFVIGGSFSQYKDFVVMTGIKTPSFLLCYQYDQTRSMLHNKSIGSHEIAMRFAINGRNKNSKSILTSDH